MTGFEKSQEQSLISKDAVSSMKFGIAETEKVLLFVRRERVGVAWRAIHWKSGGFWGGNLGP